MKLLRSAWLVSVLGLVTASSAFAQTSNGRVTTAAPSYTNATTAPFSLTTGGGLRVDIASIAATLGIVGTVAHDGVGTAVSPVLTGCYASAAAQADVSADGDAVREWCLRSGARAVQPTFAGVLQSTGNGTAGTGTPRVTIASDNTAFPVTVTNATATNLKAEVIGATSGSGTATGAIRVELPTNGTGVIATVGTITNPVTVNSHAVTNAGTFATQSAITAASGSIASGAVSSGAIASGAFASGSVASGAYASGSIAAGAVAAGATSFVKLEDVASADADAGVPAMCTRKATAANVSGTDGDYEFLQCSAGRLWASATIDAALPAGTALIGQVSLAPQTTGGSTLYTLTAANSTNATNVKASAGQVYALAGYTISATAAWLSLYNNAGTPTCGTNIIQQFLIPGSAAGAGFNLPFDNGKAFSTGIAFCLTTGIAGTGSVAASSYVVNIDYK